MGEIVRTTDPVLASAVEALLTEAGIEARIFDRDVRAIEGSIGAFPLRVVVPDQDEDRARALLTDAELL